MYKPFNEAAIYRDKITKREMRYIRKIYNQWAKDVRAETKRLKLSGSPSSLAKQRELARLYYELRNASKQLTKEIESSVNNGASDVADAVVRTNKKWLQSLGMDTSSIEYRLSYEKRSAISKVLTGDIYKDYGGISSRVWNIGAGHDRDIYNIIARGIATDRDIVDIAKDIEKYVNPQKRLPWSGVIQGANGEIIRLPVKNRKVDYNAIRLVRTTLQHTYQQVLVEVTKDNPFVSGYLWIAAGNHPCPICNDRDGNIYTASTLPYDHPNGRCEIEPVVDKEKAMADLEGFYNNPILYPKLQKFTGW